MKLKVRKLFRTEKGTKTEKSPDKLMLSTDTRRIEDFFSCDDRAYTPVYKKIRYEIPCIDAAINKIVRLTGGYRVRSDREEVNSLLDSFTKEVAVGLTGRGLDSFTDAYLDSLLVCGNAAGEIVMDKNGIAGLYNADASEIMVKQGSSPFERAYYRYKEGKPQKLPHPERIFFTALNPPAGRVYGVSLLAGLPFFTETLKKIYRCIGNNYDRLGNVRYSVCYKPGTDPEDKAFAGERVKQIAAEWNEGMKAQARGEIRDFVSAGDVSIKVIGADNPIVETEVPVRQLLEQISSKLGIPPFLLGFNWSSTERMSQQQADILTSELEYYRRKLEPVILKICRFYLDSLGIDEEIFVEWDNINLQDETALAAARLDNARAEQILGNS